MITSVSLNPCIDKMVRVPNLCVGQMNRIVDTRIDGSGKGINVSIAAHQIGIATQCIGFLAKNNHEYIENRLHREGVPFTFISYQGDVRTNLKIIETKSGRMTEVNECGSPVGESQIEELKALIQKETEKTDIFVFSGSVPPGCGDDIYYELMQCTGGKRCVLDTEGNKLRLGLRAKPFLIKPNKYELELLLSKSLTTIQDILQAAEETQKMGAEYAVVSLGADGAIMVCKEGTYYALPIVTDVKSTVGAGDCMVAGICKAYLAGRSPVEMLKYGSAYAAASVVSDGSLLIDLNRVEEMIGKVRIELI